MAAVWQKSTGVIYTPWAIKTWRIVFNYSSGLSWAIVTLCINRNRNEYSIIFLLCGFMTPFITVLRLTSQNITSSS